MKQGDEKLLLQDLSARLPYGVKCKLVYNNKAIKDEDATLFGVDKYAHFLFAEFGEDTRKFVCKPYLFPISNMTEEQKREYNSLRDFVPTYHYEFGDIIEDTELYDNFESIDYLIANHFDYRGLIEKGLAIDATGLNIY